MKSVILESYCFMGKITTEFPLSACVIMASFSFSFVFMFLIVLASVYVLCVCVCVCVCRGLFFFFRVLMRSAVSFLYTSRSVGGRCDMAVSVSKAKFRIQFVGLVCMVHLGPFCCKDISCSENDMSDLLTTLG